MLFWLSLSASFSASGRAWNSREAAKALSMTACGHAVAGDVEEADLLARAAAPGRATASSPPGVPRNAGAKSITGIARLASSRSFTAMALKMFIDRLRLPPIVPDLR